MADPNDHHASNPEPAGRIQIYLLPNLMTAGNLFCGFVALTKIVEADAAVGSFNTAIRHALFFILLACIFDLLDGRVARWGGHESPFGRQFDSLADLISFGAAPAFLVHRIVLKDVFLEHQEIGWFIASVYLICGALRLARFNCLANLPGASGTKEFLGFPIPAAAALVASLTLFIMWWEDREFPVGRWRYALPFILIFLSIMMISDVRYPSFKSINLSVQRPFAKLVVAAVFIGVLIVLRDKILPLVLPIIFTAYLVYGFIRPRISRRMRREIEDADELEEPNQPP
ncbi:MAG: CDP-diacylglycerol--serine O-phosphatidyltransferase [Verrucomicrobia bacterium]|jgi:CDP-diacylglycerol--serine O-phosphatidyltransferase|nr:CDP-diacylglycerol--serine O-phosphatidyltransferase [Verrucomicrobiota bacterium]OQC66279.1 MAG: CDP-alcohol phosphatidyltransferase [Verrucomicrobia bacterium ADurb.Bin006]MDI9380331.1 CDP-diacylglycerol--serine O-phosphatidyltransferase [Verrucomicrobiota bacterium]NMD18787.1 CDP-diacylglycerol--serine O-phosphatidyltransferase [Verrucomicrobiota bacterium]HNV00522.1 CDP-diacylglycerol--serine O-phosphatidyltransferase [Verrucomicrobiota bacterium]